MTPSITARIQENYTVDSMADKIEQALMKAGFAPDVLVPWSDLVAFDQFHVRGLEATKELAAELGLQPGQAVLDVGSGLGGPARFLAGVHGLRVTGIDLTPSFVEISAYLSQRAGLSAKLTFQQGDATELPFDDGSFDAVWTQHVAMNIADKAKLYRGIYRVLKPGGRFALYDPIQGSEQPIFYPTPWARDAGTSFVAAETELLDLLAGAGFAQIEAVDKTPIAIEWFQRQRAQLEANQAPHPLSPAAILGPELGPAIANFGRNIREGRIRLLQVTATKP